MDWKAISAHACKSDFLYWYRLFDTIPLNKEALWVFSSKVEKTMSSDQFETCPNCREIQVSTLALNCPKCGIPKDLATVSQKGKSNQKREWELLENYISRAACGTQRPDRHYNLETFCPNCGDKRLSNSAYYGRFILIILLLGTCLWGISLF